MSEARYDIIITGKLLDGTSQAQAVARVAQLFKTDQQQASSLVDGKPHRIKKAVTEDAARKFKAALTKAGLQTAVKRLERHGDAQAPQTKTAEQSRAPQTGTIGLAPEGTPVLTDDERQTVVAPALDLSEFSLADMEPWEGEERPALPEVEPPDFGLAEAGSDIDTLPDTREKLNPDTSSLSLDEPGARLGEKPKPAPPPPDTGHIKLEKHNPFL
ncbi:hypothetical protein [Litorivivens sp.]|uniref:hypothetical protein n=1 Tax=Litorivivens sp. TaxID=2020868 RepID=UPI003563E2E0